jgi:hypothetical protein
MLESIEPLLTANEGTPELQAARVRIAVLDTGIDWTDPFIKEQFKKPGRWIVPTLNRHSANSLDYFQVPPNPSPLYFFKSSAV